MYWSDSLATGVKTIDEQHKDIINKMNELFTSKKGADELLNTLQYLKNYVQKHFADEEALQIKSSYPKYQQHKQAHNEFIKNVDALFERFNKEGAVLTVILDVNKAILDLFVKHINAVDKEFAQYYREKNK